MEYTTTKILVSSTAVAAVLFAWPVIRDWFADKRLCFGVIRLDYPYEAQIGDIDFGQSTKYKAKFEIVKKLSFDLCKTGDLKNAKNHEKEIKTNLKNALLKLMRMDNMAFITGDGGFMAYFQDEILDMAKELRQTHQNLPQIPILMSSLMLLPMIFLSLPKNGKILIVTADKQKLTGDMKKLNCWVWERNIKR